MKWVLGVVVLIVVGYVACELLTTEPTPEEVRANAQKYDYKVVEYWMNAVIEKRLADMKAVCHDVGGKMADFIVEHLKEAEQEMGVPCTSGLLRSMGAPGAFKVLLASKEGVLMHLTVRAEKRDGKFWVIDATEDF